MLTISFYVCLWLQEEANAIKNMVFDQCKEVQETFGKHVQSGIVVSCTASYPKVYVGCILCDCVHTACIACMHAHRSSECFMRTHLWVSIRGPLKTRCGYTGVLANSEGDQEFMENFKKLLETRQKEQLSPQKVQLYVCLRPFVRTTCP